MAGRTAIQAKRWDDWRRFTLLVAGGWTVILTGIAATNALAAGVAVYGLCLLAIGIAMYTRPSVSTDAVLRHAHAA